MNNNYYEFLSEEEEEKAEILAHKKHQEKQTKLLIALLIVGVGVYYFLIYLKQKRDQAKAEIEQLLTDNPLVTIANLDPKLWEEKDSWEIYLSSLYLSSQIQQFTEKMTRGILEKSQELQKEERERPRKMREEVIKEAKDFLEDEERDLPEIQRALEGFITEINQTPPDNLSTPKMKFAKLIQEKRDKRKRLYWKLKDYSWADRWLKRRKESFSGAWSAMKDLNNKKEPSYFDARAIYKINFPPSLWNQLTQEQKQLAKDNGHGELQLERDVATYEFSPLIRAWESRVKINPVRGKYNPNQPDKLDNNALFFGGPRTGKSVMAEKVTYESNKCPLVTIQGSTLTPNSINHKAGIDLFLKFIFTVASINYDLVDDYGFQRIDGEEPWYILFIDEADQACSNNFEPPKFSSAGLTFLKECMGSDSKKEESKNLWIAATNHLSSINIAIYQSGRLSNPLDFSWTLAIFNHYAQLAGIAYQFPQHWKEIKTLNAEDNKQVNRFNKIIFDKDFLPFWRKFINNSDTRQELNEERDGNNKITKKGIQWGEFFEFFWQLYDSKQLENSNGKWEKPRKPTIEEVVEENIKLAANKIGGDIAKAIETRLNELNATARDTKNILNASSASLNTTISSGVSGISVLLTTIGNKINYD